MALKQDLIKLISSNKVETALEILQNSLEDREQIIAITNLSRRHYQIMETMRKSTSSDENIQLESAKIVDSLVNLVLELPDQDSLLENQQFSDEVTPPAKVNKKNGKIPVFFSHGTPFNEEQAAYEEKLKDYLAQHDIVLVSADFGEKKPLMHVRDKMREVAGCVVFAMERTDVPEAFDRKGSKRERKINHFILPSMWVQLEAGMAYQLELPILIIAHRDIPQDAIFDMGAHELNVAIIDGGDPEEILENRTISNWAKVIQKKYG